MRSIISAEATAVGAELRSVRRPRDLRRLMRDPGAVGRIADPLAPALDRITALIAGSATPVPPHLATLAVAASGVAGATVASMLEAGAVMGIELPPAAAASASAATAVALASELATFSLIASVTSAQLRAAGRDDPALLRRVLLESYLGGDVSAAGAVRGGSARLARAIVRRSLPRLAPVAGIPVAGWSSYRDLRRTRAVVERVLADDPGEPGATPALGPRR